MQLARDTACQRLRAAGERLPWGYHTPFSRSAVFLPETLKKLGETFDGAWVAIADKFSRQFPRSSAPEARDNNFGVCRGWGM